jgi:DNA-binding winged helix-turn-helix (wHTH) protein
VDSLKHVSSMKYIIDAGITYNSRDCTLNHIETGDQVQLSITSGRLLEKFLSSQGSVLAREILLEEVWDAYGLQGSNNNLNQYISILRRAFASWGCENLIITIPKVGFRLNSDIRITGEKIDDVSSEDTTEIAESAIKPEPGKLRGLLSYSKPFLLLSVLVVCVSAGIAFMFISQDFTSKEIKPVSIMLPDGCEVVFLKQSTKTEQQLLLKQAAGIVSENGMVCDSHTRIYFVNYTSFSIKNLGRTLAAYCKLDNKRRIVSCDNFYYKEWRDL